MTHQLIGNANDISRSHKSLSLSGVSKSKIKDFILSPAHIRGEEFEGLQLLSVSIYWSSPGNMLNILLHLTILAAFQQEIFLEASGLPECYTVAIYIIHISLINFFHIKFNQNT